MPSANSSDFNRPEHFTRLGNRWYCNICTSTKKNPTIRRRAALKHERLSRKHAENVYEAEMWGCPAPNATSWEAPTDPAPFSYEEMKLREPQIHPNYIKQMIPFWRSGIVAAERGYVLKMEEFLDGINQDGWEIRGGEWWAGEESTSGTPTCTLQTCKAMAERRRGFVEKYAEERGADGERRRRMHEFFEMSTQQKVNKITELLRYLSSR